MTTFLTCEELFHIGHILFTDYTLKTPMFFSPGKASLMFLEIKQLGLKSANFLPVHVDSSIKGAGFGVHQVELP